MKNDMSALSTGRLYPQEVFMVLISVRGWVDSRTIVRPEGLCQWTFSVTPAEIEPATSCLIMQCPHTILSDIYKSGLSYLFNTLIVKLFLSSYFLHHVVSTHYQWFSSERPVQHTLVLSLLNAVSSRTTAVAWRQVPICIFFGYITPKFCMVTLKTIL